MSFAAAAVVPPLPLDDAPDVELEPCPDEVVCPEDAPDAEEL
jgi:hypothetical protein